MNRTSLYCVILFLLFTTLPTAAQDFTIGVENTQNKPFWSTQKERYQGISRELLDAFAASKGYRFHYRIYPVKRLWQAFLIGDIDFKFPDNPHWQPDLDRNGHVTYSTPLYDLEEGTLVKAEHTNITADKIKRLGIVRGWTAIGYQPLIISGNIKLVESSHLAALIKMCLSGRIDAIYTNKTAYHYEADKLGYDAKRLVIAPNLPHIRTDYRLSTIKHPELIHEFNRYLAEMSHSSVSP